MTNIEDIIQSGYLEAYVLGALDNNELKILSAWLNFPEIQAYISELQNLLDHYANENQLSPSDEVCKTILNISCGCVREENSGS